jgi:hypothetical protein
MGVVGEPPAPEGTGGGAGTPAVGIGFTSFAEAGIWFGATCGVMGCHNNRYPPSLSNADLGVLESTLRNYPVPRCGDIPLVVPGDVAGSALPMIVSGECSGSWMPLGCYEQAEPPCLPVEEVERLRSWIASPDPFHTSR